MVFFILETSLWISPDQLEVYWSGERMRADIVGPDSRPTMRAKVVINLFFTQNATIFHAHLCGAFRMKYSRVCFKDTRVTMRFYTPGPNLEFEGPA